MKRRTRESGYTIVEVMIFLIITAALLASALLVFQGREERTQFSQGVREIEAQIRTVINETASGHYPNSGNIYCFSTNGGGPRLDNFTGIGQGANGGCIFLGRMIYFPSNPSKSFIVYTVVGQQRGQNGQEVTQLGTGVNDARQTLITQSTNQPTAPEAFATNDFPWGITLRRVTSPSAAAPQPGAVGFISSFGSYNGTDLTSGNTILNVMPLPNTSLGSSKTVIVQQTELLNGSSPTNPGKIVLCLRSGGGDRQAAIIIGGGSNNVSTEVAMTNVPGECAGA